MDFLKLPGRRRCLRYFIPSAGTGPSRRRRSTLRIPWIIGSALAFWLLWLSLAGGRQNWSKDSWTTLSPGRLAVYSAWSERRGPIHVTRIVALAWKPQDMLRGHLLCTLTYSNFSHVQVVTAVVEPVTADRDDSSILEPTFLICPGDPHLPADEVGLRLVETSKVHWLPVTTAAAARPLKPKHRTVAACVLSRYGTIEDLRLAEFLAHYASLGVHTFVFYNQTSTKKVRRFLGSSPVPLQVQYLAWQRKDARGILPHDCALRLRNKADVVLAVDFNEFLMVEEGKLPSVLEEAQHAVVSLPKKLFCGKKTSGNLQLVGTKRKQGANTFQVVLGDWPGLLSGKTHESDVAVVHRYADQPCGANWTEDRSATAARRQVANSALFRAWADMYSS